MSNKGKFPVPIPFGGGGNKELITVVGKRDGMGHLNTIGKSRYSKEDGTDLMILLTIGGDDQGTIDMILSLSAATFAEDGLSRGEQIMMITGMIAPGSMPGNNHDNGQQKERIGGRKRKEGEEDDD